MFIHTFDMQRLWSLLLLLFCCFLSWFYRGNLSLAHDKNGVMVLACYLLFVLVGISVFFGSWIMVSLLELSFFGVLAASALLIACFTRDRICLLGWRWVGGLILLLVACYALYAFRELSIIQDTMQLREATPGFANLRQYSDVAAAVMPLALLYIVSRKRPALVIAVLCLVPLAFWWYLLFISEGRAGILSLCIGMLMILLLFGRAAGWPVATLSLAGMVGLLGWLFLNPLRREGGVLFHRDITSDTNRFDLWRTAAQYGLENFPFGIGPMHFAADGRLSYAHAHNLFLTTAAEWGAPLATALLILVLYGSWRIYRRSRAITVNDKPVYACLVLAFVSVMVNVQFSGAHFLPLGSLVLALAVGLVFGYRDSSQPRMKRPAGSVPLQATLLWAGLMLLMAYLLYAGMELYWLSVDSRLLCMQEAGRAIVYPRFWAQGRLECMQMVDPDHWLFWSWR